MQRKSHPNQDIVLNNKQLLNKISLFLTPADMAAARQVNHSFNQHALFPQALPFHFQNMLSESINQIKDATLAKQLSNLKAPTTVKELEEFKLSLANESKNYFVKLDQSVKSLSERRKTFVTTWYYFKYFAAFTSAISFPTDCVTALFVLIMFGSIYGGCRYKFYNDKKVIDTIQEDIKIVESLFKRSELVKQVYLNSTEPRPSA